MAGIDPSILLKASIMSQSLELAIWWMPSGRARLVAVSDTLTSALLTQSWDNLADAVAAYPHIKIVHTFS